MFEELNRKLQAIPVRTETISGNVAPLLHEMRHALGRLLQEGQPGIIDLKGVPLAPGEEDEVLAFIGAGEVHAQLQTFGRSEIRESSYPGVWIVTHYDERGDLQSRFIEVTYMPEILRSQRVDIEDGLARLKTMLESQP